MSPRHFAGRTFYFYSIRGSCCCLPGQPCCRSSFVISFRSCLANGSNCLLYFDCIAIPTSRLRRATSLYTREALVRRKILHRTIHPAGMYRSAPFHSERILQHPYKLEFFNQKNMKKSSIRTEKRPKKFRLLRAYSILSYEHPPFSAGIYGQIYDYFS